MAMRNWDKWSETHGGRLPDLILGGGGGVIGANIYGLLEFQSYFPFLLVEVYVLKLNEKAWNQGIICWVSLVII